VRVERADEGALFALGAQIRVDLPQRRLDLHSRDAAHRLHGEPRRDVDDAALPTCSTSSSEPPPTKITSTSLT
jgi:hypothetical protein